MEKGNSLLIKESIFLLLLSILVDARFVRANPIPIFPEENPYIRITLLTIFFLIGTSVEYGFFKLYFNKFSANTKERNKLLSRSIILINLITYPITQILAYIIFRFIWNIFSYVFFLIFICFIEIGVVIIEWRFLNWRLDKSSNWILSSKEVLTATALANLPSFLIGMVAFIGANTYVYLC